MKKRLKVKLSKVMKCLCSKKIINTFLSNSRIVQKAVLVVPKIITLDHKKRKILVCKKISVLLRLKSKTYLMRTWLTGSQISFRFPVDKKHSKTMNIQL